MHEERRHKTENRKGRKNVKRMRWRRRNGWKLKNHHHQSRAEDVCCFVVLLALMAKQRSREENEMRGKEQNRTERATRWLQRDVTIQLFTLLFFCRCCSEHSRHIRCCRRVEPKQRNSRITDLESKAKAHSVLCSSRPFRIFRSTAHTHRAPSWSWWRIGSNKIKNYLENKPNEIAPKSVI